MRFRSIVIIATLLIVMAAVLFCCFRMKQSQRPVSQAIERCLGMPVEACGIVSNFLLDAESEVDRSLDVVYESLKEKKATQNLLVGILFIKSEADLDFELLTTAPFPRAVLEKLTIDSNKTLLLVRPEHISLVETRREPDGTIGGSFDWTIGGLMKGRCNFTYEAGVITYLGIARRNSLGLYDSQHIFYRSLDFSDLQDWQVRVYYAVVHLNDFDALRDAVGQTSFSRYLAQHGRAPLGDTLNLRMLGLDAGYVVIETKTPYDLESSIDLLVSEFGATLRGKEIQLKESGQLLVRLEAIQAIVKRHQEAPSRE